MDPNLSEDQQRLLAWLKDSPASMRRRQEQLTRSLHTSREPYRGRRTRPAQLPAPKPGSIAAIIADVERCGPELSSRRAIRWAQQLFAPAQVAAWLGSGLRTDDLELIVDLRSFGVPPEALGWVVRKETMLDRIRLRNCSARDIVRILRREGLLPPLSA